MHPQPIKAILFDLDNTLIDRSTAVHRYFSELLMSVQPDLSENHHLQKMDQIIEADQLGYADRISFCQAVVNDHLPSWSAQQLWDHFANNMPRFVHPDVECLTLLDRLSKKYTLGMVTNGSSQIQRAKLSASQIDQSIKQIVISGEIGIEKPDRHIFEKALQTLAVLPAETLYVGDHPVNDIMGARNAGLQTCWISLGRLFPENLSPPQFQIKTIHSIQTILL